MNSIELFTDTELIGGEHLTTLGLLNASLDSPPVGGFSMDEMFKRFKIKTLIDAVGTGTILELEDADMAKAKECVSAMKWGVLSPFIYKFVLAFN